MEEKKQEQKIVLFASLILLSFILMGFDKLGWLNWLKRPVEKWTNPIKENIYNREIKKLKKEEIKVIEIDDLMEKTKKIEIENASLKTRLEELEKENSAMRKLLGAPLSPAWQFIPAKVLSVKNNIITINQGSDIGIALGEIVVFENVLIGKVIKVNPVLSKIELVANKNTNIKAKISGTNFSGTVRLEANSVLILDEVLQEFTLSKGQIIVTSGEDEIYPPDLLIGKIDSMEKNEAEIFQKAILKPFLNYQTLETVFIVKN